MSKKFKERNALIHRRFSEKYPEAFTPGNTKPLRLGVFVLLTGQNPEFPRGHIASALAKYTSTGEYLRSLLTNSHRVDLDGNPFEKVSDSHRMHALELLSKRQAKAMLRAAA